MAVLLQVDFPFPGPFGEAMAEELAPLAHSINEEPGFIRKIWTENAEESIAGGIYLFTDHESARAYRDKHVARLQEMGIERVRARIFDVNESLSSINRGDAALE